MTGSEFLEPFQTKDYYVDVEKSSIIDYTGYVYVVKNKHTGVVEHENSFFSETLGYLLAIQAKFVESIEVFEEEKEKADIGLPPFDTE
jgi:hypothetical protein